MSSKGANASSDGEIYRRKNWDKYVLYDAQREKKRHLCHLRTAQVQMRVRIRAAWSGRSQFTNVYTTVSIDSSCGQLSHRLIRACIVRTLHKGPFLCVERHI